MTQETDTALLEAEEIDDALEEGEASEQEEMTNKEELSSEEKASMLQHAKRIIEALLFSSSEPVTVRRLCNVLQNTYPLEKNDVKGLLEELAQEYEEQNRAFRLEEIAKGYILRSCEEFSAYIHALLKTARPEKLSHAATEVLAIVAYRQPITRPQIDEIRGVDSSGIVNTLIERQLIEPAGKLDVPGRPTLFGITKNFLKYFGLNDLKELPNLGLKIQRPEVPASETLEEVVEEKITDEKDAEETVEEVASEQREED